jgi:hypothetical protein
MEVNTYLFYEYWCWLSKLLQFLPFVFFPQLRLWNFAPFLIVQETLVFIIYNFPSTMFLLRVLNRALSKCQNTKKMHTFYVRLFLHLHVSAHLGHLWGAWVTEYLSLKMSYIQTFIGMEWYCVYAESVKNVYIC